MSECCPLCHETTFSLFHETQDQWLQASVVKCNHCQHIYTINKPQNTSELYNDGVYKVIENRNTVFDRILNWEGLRIVKRINSHKPMKGSLLDFGCGKGKFAIIAKNKGWQVKCVETSTQRADYARKIYELEVNTNFYSSGNIFSQDFEVLTLFHVLEHLPYPGILLHELIGGNLKKNALIVIEVPNINSWQSRLAGKSWLHLDIPRHLHHFTPKRLDQLAGELELQTLHTSSFSFHLGVLGMTDSILKLLGYKRNIIYDLKTRRRVLLVTGILLLLPFALILESCAAINGRGGITRKFYKRNSKN